MKVTAVLDTGKGRLLTRHYRTVLGGDMFRGLIATRIKFDAEVNSRADVERFIATLEVIKNTMK